MTSFAKTLLLAAALAAAAAAAPSFAQESAKDDSQLFAAPLSLSAEDAPLSGRLDRLEQHMNNQELLALRRMEGVEWKITAMDNNLNRVLLIFGLLMALALFLMINYHRAQTRLLSERVNRAARESEELMRDIQRDLLRPEMEFLRIGHFLRDLMRRFFESPPEAGEVMQARSFARDPNLPVALHCIAQTLVAEYEKRWPDAVASLERLRHLEPKDPLALLHLSAAHRRLSARHHERRDKQRHLKLSNQYYAQYAVIVQMDNRLSDSPDNPPGWPFASPPLPKSASPTPTATPDAKPTLPAPPPSSQIVAPSPSAAATPATASAPADSKPSAIVKPAAVPPPPPMRSATPPNVLAAAKSPTPPSPTQPTSTSSSAVAVVSAAPSSSSPATSPPPPPPMQTPTVSATAVNNNAAGNSSNGNNVSLSGKASAPSYVSPSSTPPPTPPVQTPPVSAAAVNNNAAGNSSNGNNVNSSGKASAPSYVSPPSTLPSTPSVQTPPVSASVVNNNAAGNSSNGTNANSSGKSSAPSYVSPPSTLPPTPPPQTSAASASAVNNNAAGNSSNGTNANSSGKPSAPSYVSPPSTLPPTPPPQTPAVSASAVNNNAAGNGNALAVNSYRSPSSSSGGSVLIKSAAAIVADKIPAALGAMKFHVANAAGGARRAAQKMYPNDSEPLPFLPTPPVSEIPDSASPSELAMWQHIRQGDLRIAQAARANGFRRRNQMLDSALTHYAKAQGHKTNETLYMNWGMAFLGKALHLPPKKRDPFFNAAIDKFLAGNVIAPHRFDFALASLYSIIGREAECREWLKKSRDSGRLDMESLRAAPDFDSMRARPWFSEFLRD